MNTEINLPPLPVYMDSVTPKQFAERVRAWGRAAVEADRQQRQTPDRVIPTVEHRLDTPAASAGPMTTRKAYICKHCDGVYVDEPVSECDCGPGRDEFIEGRIQYPGAPVAAQAQPVVNQSLTTERETFQRLLEYAESQICTHEETHRGGAIWEICDQCGAMWADDEGGRPEFAWPKEIADARAALAQQPSGQDREDAERWRYVRRKMCFTGNGNGTCAMQAINLPANIPGWPDIGGVEEFCDAAIEADRQRRGEPVAWPKTAAEIRDFIDVHYISMAGDDDPSDYDKYTLTAHDLLSAFRWWTGFAPQPAEPVKVPSDADLLDAIQRYADARAAITECRCLGLSDERRRLAADDCAQAYADLNALLERYGQPATSLEGSPADTIGFCSFDHDDRFYHAKDRTWWRRDADGMLVRAEAPQPAASAKSVAAQTLHPSIKEGVEAAFEQRAGWQEKIARALRHLRDDAAQAQPVPDGWKLVPTEPTDEMYAAMPAYDGHMYSDPFNREDFLQDYAAMLNAAPTPPIAQAQPVVNQQMTTAARDVLSERQRQIEAEGWTPEHDDAHVDCSMSRAAACYALDAAGYSTHHLPFWPWDWAWWKPGEPRRNLVKAGALIQAEIERIDRAAVRAAKEKP